MPFPLPFGAASLEITDRVKQFESIVRRALGRGWLTQEPRSTIQRTYKVWAYMLAGASLAVTRLMENIHPQTALAEDLLGLHELVRHIVPDPSAEIEDRRAEMKLRTTERNNGRLISIKQELERRVGVGNVTPHQHMAADLDLAGHPRTLMFVVAYAVPVVFISTVGQVRYLDEVIKRLKAISVLGVVTRPLGGGFRTDDPDDPSTGHAGSLTDRDVLED